MNDEPLRRTLFMDFIVMGLFNDGKRLFNITYLTYVSSSLCDYDNLLWNYQLLKGVLAVDLN